MQSFDGLPTHVLAVHAPVVFMPLVLILSIVLAAKPDWRRRSGLLLAGAAGVAFVATVLAVLTGRAFDELIGDRVDTTDHEQLANTTMVIAGFLVVAAVALYLIDRRWPSSRVSVVATAAVVVLALAGTWWMIMTGDEGARLVWGNVIDATQSLRSRE
ncbi:MAG: DUF2231 domain-containing protein [Actinomycetota bacterium]